MKTSKHDNACLARYFTVLLLGLVLSAGVNFVRAQDNVETLHNGLRIKFGQVQVELTAATPDALRLSVANGENPRFTPDTFLAETKATNSIAWRVVKRNGMVGIRTKAGELLVSPANGEWTLLNAKEKVLIPPYEPGGLKQAASPESDAVNIPLGWNGRGPVSVYGCGNGVNGLQQSGAATGVGNGRAVIPYFWSPAGYAVLAVTADDNQPARWKAGTNGEYLTWTFPGRQAELYLMPAATLKEAAGDYARLTGFAPMPPRWAFGYLQSRWGWRDRAYIEDTLNHFQELKLPVDAFIYDFEWFTTRPDYAVPPNGVAGYSDFGWNTNLFPEPAAQITNYKNEGVHFVGIRKPRLGNAEFLEMIRTNGWQLHALQDARNHARDINFANLDFDDWYVRQSAPLLQAGIDGWWNDEGEGSYTTYFYWNRTELKAWSLYRPNVRFWSINRAFSPGLQRLGAAAWTGDIGANWRAFKDTPANLLNWSLAGMPYGACDIGGFGGTPSPELLTRWMEAGVFFPVMRAHSVNSATPHFPWLFGTNALTAMRDALDLRYRLIPFYYSLAHETYETGVPLMRPLVMEFPGDTSVANLSDKWMMGDSLLAAPILQPGTNRTVYLPKGGWFVFGTSSRLQGGQRIPATAGLDEIPVYVRAGSILPLGPVIQHTGQLPGGPLELQIYPGQDATFTLVEDDGDTMDYVKGRIRRTTFTWHDRAGRLTWKREGPYAGKDVFTVMRVVVFDPRGRIERQSDLHANGSITLRK
ncbi:MAG TPA: TIM-barrel domain-containing protein [Verrucomicrobiae bacterium]|nr:TIM-barrel domain-containing protein [Verrucomicrobiae bacterium]